MLVADLYDPIEPVPLSSINTSKQVYLEQRKIFIRLPYMFQLTKEEFENLKSHFATSSYWSQNAISSQKHSSTLPYAFTEQGVAMLSGFLKSKIAVDVNISIMRAFVQMRSLINENKELKSKIESLEKKYDQQFKVVFDAIKKLIQQPAEPKRKSIGFKQYKK